MNRSVASGQSINVDTNYSAFNESTSFAGTWRWNAPEILIDPNKCRYNRATDMYSFGMVLWEIATDGEVPFADVRFDFEVRERVINRQRPALRPSKDCPDDFVNLIMQCWSQKPSNRPSASTACSLLTSILDNMEKSSDEFATGASISASEFSSSIFSTHQPTRSSAFGMRITNFFKGRFSVRSSTRSDAPDDTFAKYTSPLGSDSASPASSSGSLMGTGRKRGFSRGFARLPSLNEYDFDSNQSSEMSTVYSSSPTDSIMSPIVELPVDAMLEAGGTFIEDKGPRDSELDHTHHSGSPRSDHSPKHLGGDSSVPSSPDSGNLVCESRSTYQDYCDPNGGDDNKPTRIGPQDHLVVKKTTPVLGSAISHATSDLLEAKSSDAPRSSRPKRMLVYL